MPTAKPRLTLTVEPEQYALLERLARIQRTSKSRIISELLSDVWPVVSSLTDALSAAVQAKAVSSENLRRAAEDTQRELEGIGAKVLAQVDLFATEIRRASHAEPARRVPPSAPGKASPPGGRSPAGGGANPVRRVGSPRPVITGATSRTPVAKKAPLRGRKGR